MIILKKALSFIIFFILGYVFLSIAVRNISYTKFLNDISIKAFIIFLAVNTPIFLNMMLYNPQKILSQNNISQNILSLNYIVKCFSVVLTIVVIAGNTATVSECADYYKQKDFFINHSNDYYYQNLILGNNPSVDTVTEEGNFYSEFENDIFYLCEKYMLNSSDSNIAYEANINAVPYLKTVIPEMNNIDNDADIILLYKEGTHISEEDYSFLIPSFLSNFNIKEVSYKDTSRVIVRQLGYEPITKIAKNPIILVYNTALSNICDNKQIGIQVPLSNCSVNTDPGIIKNYFNEHNISFAQTNAYDYYQYHWGFLKRTLFITIILSIMLIVLELLTISAIIKLEYTVHSKEIAIKKVIGYSITERFFKLYLIEIALGIISTIISVLINHYVKLTSDFYIFSVSFASLSLNIFVITLELLSSDKKNINKILKGGAL